MSYDVGQSYGGKRKRKNTVGVSDVGNASAAVPPSLQKVCQNMLTGRSTCGVKGMAVKREVGCESEWI